MDEGLKYASRKCNQAMAQVDISKIITLTHLIEALLTQKGGPDLNQVTRHAIVALSSKKEERRKDSEKGRKEGRKKERKEGRKEERKAEKKIGREEGRKEN